MFKIFYSLGQCEFVTALDAATTESFPKHETMCASARFEIVNAIEYVYLL